MALTDFSRWDALTNSVVCLVSITKLPYVCLSRKNLLDTHISPASETLGQGICVTTIWSENRDIDALGITDINKYKRRIIQESTTVTYLIARTEPLCYATWVQCETYARVKFRVRRLSASRKLESKNLIRTMSVEHIVARLFIWRTIMSWGTRTNSLGSNAAGSECMIPRIQRVTRIDVFCSFRILLYRRNNIGDTNLKR
jgi:hypothetical protein